MSQLFTAGTPRHCAQRSGFNVKKRSKRLLYALSSSFLTLLCVVLLAWLILRPTKPEFYLRDAAVSRLSFSSPGRLDSAVQFTLVSKNPNARVGVYYDRLSAYAAYNGQQITAPSPFPPFYQGHGDANLLSASLSGAGVPVAAVSFGREVARDQTAGWLPIRVRIGGEVRWKVGSWVSGRYRMEVDCAAVVGFVPAGNTTAHRLIAGQGSQCSTTI